jgi:hypothetical protein
MAPPHCKRVSNNLKLILKPAKDRRDGVVILLCRAFVKKPFEQPTPIKLILDSQKIL